MSKTRFTPWVVLACIGTLAGCTSGEGGTAGNTELNIILPNGATPSDLPTPDGNNGSTAPAFFDIQVVEYTITCDDGDPTPNGPFLDNGAGFDDRVRINGVLEVFDSAEPGRDGRAASGEPLTYGNTLGEIYVAQGFMDLPTTQSCKAQLRARDSDDEVICSDTVTFTTEADKVTTVNVVMYCGLSFQAPVAQLDLAGDFSFNVSNFCPDLFVLNCIDTDIDIRGTSVGEVAATACQVRARDGDSQCGDSCDPQSCVVTPDGLVCTPAPEPTLGLKTTVTCDPPGFACAAPGATFGAPCNPLAAGGDNSTCGLPDANTCAPGSPNAGDSCDSSADDAGNSDCGLPPPSETVPAVCVPPVCAPGAVMDCTGTNQPAANCEFDGDVLGVIGAPAPGPLAPGEGGFFVACVLADNDGDPTTPNVPITPGATVTCEAVTTDGDVDCNKKKTVDVVCPGLTPCQQYADDNFVCDDGSECTINSCNDALAPAGGCGGADNGPCCETTAVPDSPAVACDDFDPQPGLCVGGVCESQGCNIDDDCPGPDGNCLGQSVCTNFVCGAQPFVNDTGACDNSGEGSGVGVCDAVGVCNSTDLCGLPGDPACPDTNECNLGFCDTTSGPWACGVDPNLADGLDCNAGTGVCAAGSCDVPPFLNPAVADTGYRAAPRICPRIGPGDTPGGQWPYIDSGDSPTGGAGACALCLSDSCSGGTNGGSACTDAGDCPGGTCISATPSNVNECALDCFTYLCNTPDPTALFPGGGPVGACAYPSTSTNCPVRGCQVVSNTLKNQLGVDTLIFLEADAAGQTTRQLTLTYNIRATNNALGLAGSLAAVNDVTVVSTLTNANPSQIINKLNTDLSGDDVSDFLNDELVFIINDTQLLPTTEVVTPTASPVTVAFDETQFIMELIIKSSGAPLDITGANCTFSNEAGTCVDGGNKNLVCNPSDPNGGPGGADCSVEDPVSGLTGICVNTGGAAISLGATFP